MGKTKTQLRHEREKKHNVERAKAEMIRLSNELHGGGIAPNSAEYEMYREDAPGREFVNRHYGKWQNFAEFCGLELREAQYYYDKRKERATEWAAIPKEPKLSVASAGRKERNEALAGMGLKYCKAQQVTWQDRVGRVYQEMRYELR